MDVKLLSVAISRVERGYPLTNTQAKELLSAYNDALGELCRRCGKYAYRVYKLREMGFDPYIMVYDKPRSPRTIRWLQRWVNNKYVFRTCGSFDEYARWRGDV
jgi:hypothetical protein